MWSRWRLAGRNSVQGQAISRGAAFRALCGGGATSATKEKPAAPGAKAGASAAAHGVCRQRGPRRGDWPPRVSERPAARAPGGQKAKRGVILSVSTARRRRLSARGPCRRGRRAARAGLPGSGRGRRGAQSPAVRAALRAGGSHRRREVLSHSPRVCAGLVKGSVMPSGRHRPATVVIFEQHEGPAVQQHRAFRATLFQIKARMAGLENPHRRRNMPGQAPAPCCAPAR